MTSQNFHSLGFSWARQCGVYSQDGSEEVVPQISASLEDKMVSWRQWAAQEVQARAVLGHYILDGQISQFSGYPTSTRHTTNTLFLTGNEAAFEADSVDQWIIEMEKGTRRLSFREMFLTLFSQQIPCILRPIANFSLHIILEGLQSTVSEIWNTGDLAAGMLTKADVSLALLRLYNQCLKSPTGQIVPFRRPELLMRWHLLGLDLASCSATLCRHICANFGIQQTLLQSNAKPVPYISLGDWAMSIDGWRALLHASAIHDLAGMMPLGRANAICIPAVLFASAIVYAAHCLGNHRTAHLPSIYEWSDIWSETPTTYHQSMPTSIIQDIVDGVHSSPARSTVKRDLLYELTSLKSLMRVSLRWGVSKGMDELLQQWISAIHCSVSTNISLN